MLALAPPAVDPPTNTYPDSVMVTMTPPTTGATIYYEIADSTGTSGTLEYTGPFTLTETSQVAAIALQAFNQKSVTINRDYTISAAAQSSGSGVCPVKHKHILLPAMFSGLSDNQSLK